MKEDLERKKKTSLKLESIIVNNYSAITIEQKENQINSASLSVYVLIH